jgi:hypothetical protein
MSTVSGHPAVVEGELVDLERERRARLALAEESTENASGRLREQHLLQEIARLEAENARLEAESGELQRQVIILREGTAPMAQDTATVIALLAQEHHTLAWTVQHQISLSEQLRAEAESQRRFAQAARVIFMDLMGSRAWRMIRLSGRWESVERKIHRALRQL